MPGSVARVISLLCRGDDAAIVAQPGYGMMIAHWFDDAEEPGERIRQARAYAHGVGGSLIVEKAAPAVKDSIDVWDYAGASLEVMKSLKAQYDPNGILNPNRFTGGI